jgi:uncharacterized protein
MTSEDLSGFLPGQHSIDAVGNGGFRFADMSHRGSILILPSGIYAWRVKGADEFSRGQFQAVLDAAPDIDIFIIGTGSQTAVLTDDLLWALRSARLNVDIMPTLAAARTFNVLLNEQRRIAAALIAVP